MSNELLEICERLERDSYTDPTGIWVVTRAEKKDGGWDLHVEKEKQQEVETDDK